jgi:urease accessory protein
LASLSNDNRARTAGSGLLDVVLSTDGSVVGRARAESPLRLLTPRNAGQAAWVFTGSYGGGLVGGDALALRMRVGKDARAFVSTQASTKVYRSPDGTSVDLDAVVEDGGLLVLWPDPVVCFAGSTYRQRQHFELHANASLVVVDWMTSGRRASGERWLFETYSSRSSIHVEGRPALVDALLLSPADGSLAARMGRFDVIATVAVYGCVVKSHAARILADVSALPVERSAESLVSAAPVGSQGCLLRITGRSVEQVTGLLRHRLSFVSGLLGDDPWARKW